MSEVVGPVIGWYSFLIETDSMKLRRKKKNHVSQTVLRFDCIICQIINTLRTISLFQLRIVWMESWFWDSNRDPENRNTIAGHPNICIPSRNNVICLVWPKTTPGGFLAFSAFLPPSIFSCQDDTPTPTRKQGQTQTDTPGGPTKYYRDPGRGHVAAAAKSNYVKKKFNCVKGSSGTTQRDKMIRVRESRVQGARCLFAHVCFCSPFKHSDKGQTGLD